MAKKVNNKENKEDKNLQVFADLVIDKLSKIEGDWKQPWFNANEIGEPRNISGRPYSFGNAFMLALFQQQKNYQVPVYMTFHQAVEEGISVKRGEKAFPIYYWNFFVKDEEGKKIPVDDFKNMTREEKEKCKVIPFLKYFQVFNVDQTTMKEVKPEKYESLKSEATRPLIKDEEGRLVSPEIDLMIKEQSWVCPIHCQESSKAFYSIGKDEITAPLKGQYPDAEEYYTTLLHEMAHSTGAESRLKRPFGMFGDDVYAREELIAELTAGLVAMKMGISSTISDNNIRYVKSWMKNLSENPKFIISLLGDITKAGDMIESVVFSEEAKRKIKENAIQDIQSFMEKKEEEAKKFVPVMQPESFSIKEALENGKALEQAPANSYAPLKEVKEEQQEKMVGEPEQEKREVAENISPIMIQYKNLKLKHPDALLLFRVGDFYETYQEDAEKASKILRITLSQKESVVDEKGNPLKMAGFPCHSLDTYLPKLIRAGQRVAICDQEIPRKLTHKRKTEETKKQEEKELRTAVLEDGIYLWEEGDLDYKGHITTDRKVVLEGEFTKGNGERIKELAEKGNMMKLDENRNTILALQPLNEPTKLQVNLETGEINRLSVESFLVEGREYRAACKGMEVVAEMDDIERLSDLTDDKLEELAELADRKLEEAKEAIAKSVMYGEPWELVHLQKEYHAAAKLKLQDEYNEEQVQRVILEIVQDAQKEAAAMYEQKNKEMNENKNHSINQTKKSMEENQKTQEEKVLKDGVNIFKMNNGFYGINVVKDGERSVTHRLSKEDTQAYFDGLKGQPIEEVNRRRNELAAKYFSPEAEKKQEAKAIKPLPKVPDEVRKRISDVSVFKMQDDKNYAVRAKIDGVQISATRVYKDDIRAFFDGFKEMDNEAKGERKAELAAKYFKNELSAEKMEVKSGMSR